VTPRTFVTQQDLVDARHDIEIKGYGTAFLLVPKTKRARRWLQPWPTTAVEPHRVADVVADAREAGLAVRQ
jgi:hypothetical protein